MRRQKAVTRGRLAACVGAAGASLGAEVSLDRNGNIAETALREGQADRPHSEPSAGRGVAYPGARIGEAAPARRCASRRVGSLFV